MNIRRNAAARHAKFQRLQAQVSIFEDDMSRKIANRQATAMLNAPPFEANIGIHNVPFIGFEAVIRQHFARRLNAFFALLLFRPFRLFCPFPGVNAN